MRHLDVTMTEDPAQSVETPALHTVVTRKRVPQIVEVEVSHARVFQRLSERGFHVRERRDIAIVVEARKNKLSILHPAAMFS